MAEVLDDQSGNLLPQGATRKTTRVKSMFFGRDAESSYEYGEFEQPFYGDEGGASRFYHHIDTLAEVVCYLEKLFEGETLITLDTAS